MVAGLLTLVILLLLSFILFGVAVFFCVFLCLSVFFKGYIFVTSNNLIINDNTISFQEPFTGLQDII